eukprot:UN32048
MPDLEDDRLTAHRKEATQFRSEKVNELNLQMIDDLKNIDNSNVYFMDVYPYVEKRCKEHCSVDGVHNMERARKEAESFVNALTILNKEEAVFPQSRLTPGQVMFVLLYGVIIVLVVPSELGLYLWTRVQRKFVHLEADLEYEKKDNTGESSALVVKETSETTKGDTAKPISPKVKIDGPSTTETIEPPVEWLKGPLLIYKDNQTFFRACMTFFAVITCVFLMDGPYWRPFKPALKQYNRDFFLFLHIGFLIIAYLKMGPTFRSKDDILSRDQTEEWKGIMQIIFVMYHYFDARETYNLIRIFIAAYVWMTGYGNTCFFLNPKRQDVAFGFTRLLQMFFRLNWLVFWVCTVLNQPLLLYYICPLHTFSFLYVFIMFHGSYS